MLVFLFMFSCFILFYRGLKKGRIPGTWQCFIYLTSWLVAFLTLSPLPDCSKFYIPAFFFLNALTGKEKKSVNNKLNLVMAIPEGCSITDCTQLFARTLRWEQMEGGSCFQWRNNHSYNVFHYRERTIFVWVVEAHRDYKRSLFIWHTVFLI